MATASNVKDVGTAPVLHALVAVPAVSSLVWMLVAVGIAAAAIGVLHGVAGKPGVRQRVRRGPP
jgi:hypothetical protein